MICCFISSPPNHPSPNATTIPLQIFSCIMNDGDGGLDLRGRLWYGYVHNGSMAYSGSGVLSWTTHPCATVTEGNRGWGNAVKGGFIKNFLRLGFLIFVKNEIFRQNKKQS